MNDATAFAQDAWWKGSRENVTQSVAMPLQPDERNFQNNEIMAQEIRGTAKDLPPCRLPKQGKLWKETKLPLATSRGSPILLLRRVRRRPLTGSQTETSGPGHSLPEAGRRAEGSLPWQRSRKENCALSGAHGACGTGGKLKHYSCLRGQSGCPVPPHLQSKFLPERSVESMATCGHGFFDAYDSKP